MTLPIELSNETAFGSRQRCCMSNNEVVSHTQNFVTYAIVYLCFLYTEQFSNYFDQKLTFFLKLNKFQSLKVIFSDFSLSANLV